MSCRASFVSSLLSRAATKRPPALISQVYQNSFEPLTSPRVTTKHASKANKIHKRSRKSHPKIIGPVFNHVSIREYLAMASSSPLLGLPAELRNMIYRHALSSPTNCLVFDSTRKRFNVSSIGAGLITTCHSIHLETQYLPLQLNTLVFDIPTADNVDFMVFLARLNRLEAAMGWTLRLDIKLTSKDIHREGANQRQRQHPDSIHS